MEQRESPRCQAGDPLSEREHEVKMRTLWCGSLSDKVDDRILYELFLNAGPLEKVTIPRDKAAFSTLIGRGQAWLDSDWSRGSECC